MPRPSMQGKTDTAKAVSYFAEHGVTIAVPLDSGVGLLATKLALKAGAPVIAFLSTPLSGAESDAGAPVIAFLSTPLSGAESDEIMEIQAEIFANGLLLSIFPPFQKSERWHVMIRNRFIASVSSSVFLGPLCSLRRRRMEVLHGPSSIRCFSMEAGQCSPLRCSRFRHINGRG